MGLIIHVINKQFVTFIHSVVFKCSVIFIKILDLVLIHLRSNALLVSSRTI